MNTPRQDLEAEVRVMALKLFPQTDWEALAPLVRPCPNPAHGDFQINLALTQAKEAKMNPRDLATKIKEALEIDEIVETPEIAGPGFLNLRLKPDYLARQISQRASSLNLGITPVEKPETVVVDFSSPNIAKEMHVGHLRSTVLGDCLARIHRFRGEKVITDNHLGDWGTGLGLVLLAYKREGDPEKLNTDPFNHLENLYKKYYLAGKEDPEMRELAKRELVLLQQGDDENRKLWKEFIDLSLQALREIYQKLGVSFDYWLGESSYNEQLGQVVKDLVQKGIARKSEGAVAIFSDGKGDPKEDPFLIGDHGDFRDNPLLMQKSDTGFNYATTDLATLAHRAKNFKADRILYVVDGRQQLHFRQLFAAARRWGFKKIGLEHVWFGTILGADKRPIKTRDGGEIKLKMLIREAEERAARILAEKRPEMEETLRAEVARVVGVGALKYADLAQNRNLDYVFSWDKLLAFDGNTAPYLQNGYVRIRAIFRKAGLTTCPEAPVVLQEAAEIGLAKKLLEFSDSVQMAAVESRPHYLCSYLFELATHFHRFYEACPVLKDEVTEELKNSRLVLCDFTARTLRQGLNLLGLETVEEM